MPDKIHTLPTAIHLYLGARLFKAGLRQPRVSVKFEYRCKSLTSKFSPGGKKKYSIQHCYAHAKSILDPVNIRLSILMKC